MPDNLQSTYGKNAAELATQLRTIQKRACRNVVAVGCIVAVAVSDYAETSLTAKRNLCDEA